ncbi:hypothetical protein Zmor_005451 [Zophobas morio]|uniref:Uncharacterized protein n=1 Tax=Zophobas morio TaxID=2755281 RepID=A0AA38IS67_9CUCU|nr:hypothetical protein Zmor_005451 [Zophobas morio]
MGTCLLRYPRRDVETQRRRSEVPVDVESRFLVTLQLFWEGSQLPTTVGIHRIRSPTRNWLQFSITGIARSATKTKKSCGSTAASPMLAGWSSALNPKSDKVVVLECTISFTAHKCAPSDSTF